MTRDLLDALLRIYQAVSPAFPKRCRFYPTCSVYAREALRAHGAGRGTWLTLKRLAKCHPWHPGGVDEVPLAGRMGAGASPLNVGGESA